MNDQTAHTVEPYDTTGAPSRGNLIAKILGLFGISFLPIGAMMLFLPDTISISGKTVMWGLLGLLAWICAIALTVSTIQNKYDRLYRYLQRGVITEIDPKNTRVLLDGITGANLPRQQWCSIPADIWRDAEKGQVIDLASVYRR